MSDCPPGYLVDLNICNLYIRHQCACPPINVKQGPIKIRVEFSLSYNLLSLIGHHGLRNCYLIRQIGQEHWIKISLKAITQISFLTFGLRIDESPDHLYLLNNLYLWN